MSVSAVLRRMEESMDRDVSRMMVLAFSEQGSHHKARSLSPYGAIFQVMNAGIICSFYIIRHNHIDNGSSLRLLSLSCTAPEVSSGPMNYPARCLALSLRLPLPLTCQPQRLSFFLIGPDMSTNPSCSCV